jgi:hypothetical protein
MDATSYGMEVQEEGTDSIDEWMKHYMNKETK